MKGQTRDAGLMTRATDQFFHTFSRRGLNIPVVVSAEGAAHVNNHVAADLRVRLRACLRLVMRQLPAAPESTFRATGAVVSPAFQSLVQSAAWCTAYCILLLRCE